MLCGMALRITSSSCMLQSLLKRNYFGANNKVQNIFRTSQSKDCSSTSNNNVRVRFAPSPTGHIHLGGLRTALYNYLFAKSHDGKFLLRIEDTDQERLVPGAAEKLVEILEWAGIEIDEGPFHGGNRGPYVQSQRLDLYKEHIQTLLQNGTAYHCFCTVERLELLKKQQLSRRETPKYDNRCRHLSSEEVAEKRDRGEPHIVRFELQSCDKPWTDLVYGNIQSDVAAIEGDPVLMKSDGYPTYHFANVVDDHFMDISHVLRGVEWQVSTKKHILLYEAFGWSPPRFGHLPLLVNKNGKKFSKRDGDMHVESLQKRGYFPESIMNFLCFCGSGFTGAQLERKGMYLGELIDCFDIKEVNTRPSKLDFLHLQEINRIFMGNRLDGPQKSELIESVRDVVKEHFKHCAEVIQESTLHEDNVIKILNWAQDSARIHLVEDLVDKDMEFLWCNMLSDSVAEDIKLACKTHSPQCYLQAAITFVKDLEVEEDSLTIERLSPLLAALLKEQKFPIAEFMKALRLTLYGQKKGPPIAELIAILGKPVTLDRMTQVLSRISDNSNHTETVH